MTFDWNLETVDLKTVKRSDIKTFLDLSTLAQEVRFKIDTTYDLESVYRYCDLMLFISKKFPVNPDHFKYIKEKSDIDFSSEDMDSHILKYYHDKVQGILNNGHCFNVEFDMRPLQTIFWYKDNLTLPWWKSKHVSKRTFQELIEKVWFFIEFYRKQTKHRLVA